MRYLVLATLLISGTGLSGEKVKSGSFVVTDSTVLDFEDTLVDGQMKAPSGFFLQGRNKQSLSNMVKLRSNFKDRLRRSAAAVKSVAR